jgi:probable phosphoglycerate mutase
VRVSHVIIPQYDIKFVGETRHNAEGLLQGSGIDAPLSARGHQQAQQLAQSLRQFSLDLVCSSALTRAVATAGAIRDAQRLQAQTSSPTVIDGYNEMFYGNMEGVPLKDVKAELGRLSKAWASGATTEPVCSGEITCTYTSKFTHSHIYKHRHKHT